MTKIFDLKIFNKSFLTLQKRLSKSLNNKKGLTIVFTPNPEQVIQSRRDPVFLKRLQQADLLIPDGVGLVVASRLFSEEVEPIKTRITGIETTEFLLKFAKKKNLKVLVIGGRDFDKVDEKSSGFNTKKTKWPGVSKFISKNRDFYWTPGFVSIHDPLVEEHKNLVNLLTDLKPHIVFVAFGAPSQERWSIEHKEFLQKKGVRLVMVVGGSFDFILNELQRAPLWMQKTGLEWLFRLMQQPWRWHRQLRLLKFSTLVIREIFN